MAGLLTQVHTETVGGHWREDRVVDRVIEAIRLAMPGAIRVCIEANSSLALDARADREALIRDLLEALS